MDGQQVEAQESTQDGILEGVDRTVQENLLTEVDSNSPFKRGEVWFDDGNIVLFAQDTAFRVHQGVLSKSSQIFATMFTIPQPPDGGTIEGCPVVCLTDSSMDVERILSILYDGGRSYVRVLSSFATLLILLRTGS